MTDYPELDDWLLDVARLGGGMDDYGAPTDDEIKEFNTFKEAKAFISALMIRERVDELKKYRDEHFKHHDSEYCLDNFNNFEYVLDRIRELKKGSR